MESMSTIEVFIDQHDISMNMKRNPRFETGHDGVSRYKCTITRPGKEISVYVEAPTEEERLTPSDVMFMLILDASGCEMMKDYYGMSKEAQFIGNDGNFSEFEEFWREYRKRSEQSDRFRAFLGQNLYEELIDQFGFQD